MAGLRAGMVTARSRNSRCESSSLALRRAELSFAGHARTSTRRPGPSGRPFRARIMGGTGPRAAPRAESRSPLRGEGRRRGAGADSVPGSRLRLRLPAARRRRRDRPSRQVRRGAGGSAAPFGGSGGKYGSSRFPAMNCRAIDLLPAMRAKDYGPTREPTAPRTFPSPARDDSTWPRAQHEPEARASPGLQAIPHPASSVFCSVEGPQGRPEAAVRQFPSRATSRPSPNLPVALSGLGSWGALAPGLRPGLNPDRLFAARGDAVHAVTTCHGDCGR
jgi:hypothetical protein